MNDDTLAVIAKLAQSAGISVQEMQKALGTLDQMELLTLAQIGIARAKNKGQ